MSAVDPKDTAPAERVEATLDELMAEDEFIDLFDGLDLGEPIFDLGGQFVAVLFWCVLAVMLVWAAVALARTMGLGRGEGAGEEAATGEHRRRRVTEALAAAARARRAGDLRGALAHHWAALVTGLGRGEAVAWRPAWTCREMLARSRPGAEPVRLLAELLPEVERLEFSRDPVTVADVDRLAALCDEHLGAALAQEEQGP